MKANIFDLLKKEYLLGLRNYHSVTGILIFNGLLTLLICALFRSMRLAPEEIGLIACPYLWLILVLSIFRFLIQNMAEESNKLLFLKQLRDGYCSYQIFYSKLISALIFGLIIIGVEFFIFILLMGYLEILYPLIGLAFVYAISLPALVGLSIIGACISHRSSHEEILMPIVLLPLILLLSIAVVSLGEDLFSLLSTSLADALDKIMGYWFNLLIGLQLILVLSSEMLFRILSRLKK